MAKACGRLALACESLYISCGHIDQPSLKCTTSTRIPDRKLYSVTHLSSSNFSVFGVLGPAPDGPNQVSTSFQEVSINGVPVVNTTIHDQIEETFTRLCRPTTRAVKEIPQPSYILKLSIPEDTIVFVGPVLNLSALIPQASPLQALVARCMINAWREFMPASVLAELEATIKRLKPADSPSHPTCTVAKQQQQQPARDRRPPTSALHISHLSEHTQSLIHQNEHKSVHHDPIKHVARPGPYNSKRTEAVVKPHTSRIAMLKARRVLARLSAPCLHKSSPRMDVAPAKVRP